MSSAHREEGGVYVSGCVELEVASCGETSREAPAMLRDAVDLSLENPRGLRRAGPAPCLETAARPRSSRRRSGGSSSPTRGLPLPMHSSGPPGPGAGRVPRPVRRTVDRRERPRPRSDVDEMSAAGSFRGAGRSRAETRPVPRWSGTVSGMKAIRRSLSPRGREATFTFDPRAASLIG